MRSFGAAVLALWLAGCASTVSTARPDAGSVDVVASPDAPPPLDRPSTPGDASTLEVSTGDARPDAAEDVAMTSCERATELRDGDVLSGQTFGDEPEQPPACTGFGAITGPMRWFHVTVPAGDILEVDVREPAFDRRVADVLMLSGCGAATCLANPRGASDRPLLYRNEGSAPQRVVVAVVRNPDPRPGAFTIAARVRHPATNSTCATATPLVEGVTLRGQDIGGSTERERGCVILAGNPGAPALYYTITVPPRRALRVLLRAESQAGLASPFVVVRPPCGTPGCLPNTFESSAADPVGQFNNASDAPVPVRVAVAAHDTQPLPTVSVTATFRALPSNTTCVAATPLVAGVATRVEHPEDATDPPPSTCRGTLDATTRALFYTVTVPAGQTLTATATEADGTSVGASEWFVRLFDDCGGACLSAEHGTARTSRAVFPNAGPSSQRVVVAIGSIHPSSARPLSLRTSLRPASASLTCAGAPMLTPGTPLRDIDMTEARALASCPAFNGPVHFYAVRVTPGSTLTLEATGDFVGSEPRPRLAILAACGGACVAQGAGAGAALTYVHRGDAQTVLVAMGQSGDRQTSALVTLNARLE